MARITLFLFEGAVREHEYFTSLRNAILDSSDKPHAKNEGTILCSMGNNLYQLYEEVKEDADLNLPVLLKDGLGNPNNRALLQDIDEDQITDIYLLFDMELQDSRYKDEKLISMLETFNDEAELGKLIISYPMIEAIRHIHCLESYLDLKINANECRGRVYKSLSVKETMAIYHDHRKITFSHWRDLIVSNISKSNYLIRNVIEFSFPPSQLEIAEFQIENINDSSQLYILSSIPFFAIDYYGIDTFTQKN